MEELLVFQLYEEVADWVWAEVDRWPTTAVRTIGEQLIRAIDSVNANLVEGDGRFSTADSLRFFIIARGSAREARLWIRRAAKRNLVDTKAAEVQIEKLTSATRLLNVLIGYRREKRTPGVKETRTLYSASTDPVQESSDSADPFEGGSVECSL
jgi:four helix bundle protein